MINNTKITLANVTTKKIVLIELHVLSAHTLVWAALITVGSVIALLQIIIVMLVSSVLCRVLFWQFLPTLTEQSFVFETHIWTMSISVNYILVLHLTVLTLFKLTTIAFLCIIFTSFCNVYNCLGDVRCSSHGWEFVWLGEGGEEVEGVCEWDAQADRRLQSSMCDGDTGHSRGARHRSGCLWESCRWKRMIIYQVLSSYCSHY